jgi:flavin reductase (DIM6/NTAB) family NADH-FMN oxidoreductase RutF
MFKYKIKKEPRGPREESDWPLFLPSTAIMISCQGWNGRPNIIPVIAVAVMSHSPLTIGTAICQDSYNERYWERKSYRMMLETMAFVCNVPDRSLSEAITLTGRISGWEIDDKFAMMGLHAVPGVKVQAPVIAECPLNYECKVTSIVNLGSHDWFIGEVVWMHIDEDVVAGKKELAWNQLAIIHDRRRRCGNCGSGRLQAVTMAAGVPLACQPAMGGEAMNLEPFTCQECGHLEWFIK